MPAQYKPLADDVPPVTAAEYVRARTRLGISNTGAERLLGIAEATSRRLSNGSNPVPGPLGRLVRLIEAQRLTADHVWSWIEPVNDDVPPVTAAEYRRAMARLGINNTEAGELFGISAVTSRRFSTGSQAVPGPLGRLVRLIEAQRLTVDQLRTWFEPVEGTTR